MQNHHSNTPPLITTLTSHYFILHLSSPFQLESRVEHHMIQPNQPLTPHPLNNEKKRMETGTNGETPATSELDLSIILQGILGLSLSWMVSTFIHVLSLLLLWGSEDAVLDELMKRLFCFACWWRCEWMSLRLNEWEGQCDEMKEQPRSPIAVVDLFIPGASCMFCWVRLIVLPVLLRFPWDPR